MHDLVELGSIREYDDGSTKEDLVSRMSKVCDLALVVSLHSLNLSRRSDQKHPREICQSASHGHEDTISVRDVRIAKEQTLLHQEWLLRRKWPRQLDVGCKKHQMLMQTMATVKILTNKSIKGVYRPKEAVGRNARPRVDCQAHFADLLVNVLHKLKQTNEMPSSMVDVRAAIPG